jgi:hypothetical protein
VAVVLAAAMESGGASALIPVVRRLATESAHRVQLVAAGQAIAAFRDAGMSAAEAPSGWGEACVTASSLIEEHRPQAVLTAVGMPQGIELALLRAARGASVPSMALVDSWTNYLVRFVPAEEPYLDADSLPDVIGVPDEFAAREMAALGFPADRLSVVGQPTFDDLIAWVRTGAPETKRHEVRAALRVEDGEQLAVFFSQPIGELFGEPGAETYRGYDETTVLSDLLTARLPDRVTLVVKPHPRENAAKISACVKDAGSRARVLTEYSVLDLLAAADVALGMTSMALVQSLLVGTPVVSIQPGLRVDDALVLGRMGLILPVTDPARITAALGEALGEQASASLPELPSCWTDGQGTDRTAQLVRGLLTRAASPAKER